MSLRSSIHGPTTGKLSVIFILNLLLLFNELQCVYGSPFKTPQTKVLGTIIGCVTGRILREIMDRKSFVRVGSARET